MRTLLFLDITGVLYCRNCEDHACNHLQNLGRIVHTLGCDIVLTTSFRFDERFKASLRKSFAEHGIPAWIGATPDLHGERWTEIRRWVDDHDASDHRLVIIDDRPDADLATNVPDAYHCHFFWSDPDTGLDAALTAAVLSLAGQT